MKRTTTTFLFACLLSVSLSSVSRAAVIQPSPIPLGLAERYFREAELLSKRDHSRLWGHILYGPMMFADPKTRFVVANQADREGRLARTGNVFVGELPATMNVANTAGEWAGVKWTMMVFPVPKDKMLRDKLMVHELWHRIQDEVGFPSSGAANNHLDSFDGRVWLQLEWRALVRALTSKGVVRREAISDALLFRAYRRMLFPEAAREEREMEMHEGLAEYTGVRLSGIHDAGAFVAENNLRDAMTKESFVRSFAYASGPAYGVLLDEARKDWRKGLTPDRDLAALLQNILDIRLTAEVARAAQERGESYSGAELLASETKRQNDKEAVMAKYRARLVDGPVLVMPFQKMRMQFNPGNLLPMGTLGTVYPDIRIVDVWGILTVSKGGALMTPTYSMISVCAPAVTGGSQIHGDGWTLELNPGWRIVAGERKGDYLLRSN